jgi:hypothetical protein
VAATAAAAAAADMMAMVMMMMMMMMTNTLSPLQMADLEATIRILELQTTEASSGSMNLQVGPSSASDTDALYAAPSHLVCRIADRGSRPVVPRRPAPEA